MIALTWGGIQYSWASANVLVPLVLGLAGLALFGYYEARVAEHPIVSPPAPPRRPRSRAPGPVLDHVHRDVRQRLPPDLHHAHLPARAHLCVRAPRARPR